MWGRKYPSVSPSLCPHCTDHHYSLTHTWPSGGWGLLLVITLSWWLTLLTVFTLHGQMSALFTIFTSPSTVPRSDVWSIFWNVTTKRQRNIVDRDNWFENIALGNFLAMIMTMTCMIIYTFSPVWISHPRHYNIYLSGVRIMVCGHIVTRKGERYSGKWCNGGGYHY